MIHKINIFSAIIITLFISSILLLCDNPDPVDETLEECITGSWERQASSCTLTFSSNGTYKEKCEKVSSVSISAYCVELGNWYVEGSMLVLTNLKGNCSALGYAVAETLAIPNLTPKRSSTAACFNGVLDLNGYSGQSDDLVQTWESVQEEYETDTMLNYRTITRLTFKDNGMVEKDYKQYRYDDYGNGELIKSTLSYMAWSNESDGIYLSECSLSPQKNLWKSDGTSAGTKLVKDFNPSGEIMADYGGINFRMENGNNAYFTKYSLEYGYDLWTSDGTEQGTHVLSGVIPYGTPGLNWFTYINDKFFFTESLYGIHNCRIWRSDGTSDGTLIVKDNSGGCDYNMNFISAFGSLFFIYINPNDNNFDALWTSDGTVAGTKLVKDFYPEGEGASINAIMAEGESLFFLLKRTSENRETKTMELWKSNGTEAGTVFVKKLYDEIFSDGLRDFAFLNGLLYFVITDDSYDDYLWVTDGTPEGTSKIMDLGEGEIAAQLPPLYFTELNNNLYFLEGEGRTENEVSSGSGTPMKLFKISGTSELPVIIKKFTDKSIVRNLIKSGNYLYFAANTELWRSDGTEAGTVIIKDFDLANSSDIYSIAPASQGVLLTIRKRDSEDIYQVTSAEIWKSSGTPESTELLRVDPEPSILFPAGDNVFFTATDDPNDQCCLIKSSTEAAIGIKNKQMLIYDRELLED